MKKIFMKKIFMKKFVGIALLLIVALSFLALPNTNQEASAFTPFSRGDAHLGQCKVVVAKGFHSNRKAWIITEAKNRGCTVQARITYSPTVPSPDIWPKYKQFTSSSTKANVVGVTTAHPALLGTKFYVQACAGGFGCGSWVEVK